VCDSEDYNWQVTRQHHYYGGNHLHYLTAFDSQRFRRHFVEILSDLRTRLEFKIIGYVLMPEHFHLLIWPSGRANPSQIVQSLKERTALFRAKRSDWKNSSICTAIQ
jgi:REP element-mobilizing transposase RayT